ncbi:MAG: SLC13 family permease, partial [Fimbriimonadales bacterium]
MTLEIALVLGLVVGAVALFISNRFPPEVVAVILLVTLLLSGLVSTEQGLRGFSNSAVITIASMFVLSEGLRRSGLIDGVIRFLGKLARVSPWLAVVLLLLLSAFLSAFVNNTAVVALFIPVALALAENVRRSPSKLLLPISYASMLGGVCTLIGTSTNLIVSGVAQQRGLEPLGMFEFAPMGLIFTGIGMVYLLTIGARLLPDRRAVADPSSAYQLGNYLAEVVVTERAKSAGTLLMNADFVRELGTDVLDIWRDGVRLLPLPDRLIQAGDVLRVRCDIEKLQRLQKEYGLRLISDVERHDEPEEEVLLEVVITPGAALEGQSLKSSRFRNRYGATVLALRHRQSTVMEQIADVPLQAGDVLLIRVSRDRLPELLNHPDFLVVSQMMTEPRHPLQGVLAGAIMVGVITIATLGWYPTEVTAMGGALLMVLTRILKTEEAVQAIDWRLLVMLGAMLALGKAMETTGAARWMTMQVVASLGALGPFIVLS